MARNGMLYIYVCVKWLKNAAEIFLTLLPLGGGSMPKISESEQTPLCPVEGSKGDATHMR